jgi:hypothetical protein
MKFKIVEVYSGYNEMSISGDVVIKEREDIKGLINELFEGLKNKFVDNDETDFWNEFSDKGVINEELGFYGCAEEGFNLVIREDNNWYNRLSNYENWTDIENEEWREFCGSIA